MECWETVVLEGEGEEKKGEEEGKRGKGERKSVNEV